MKISVKSKVGERCNSWEQGRVIYESILPILKTGTPVTLDFTGTAGGTLAFFEWAVGRLFNHLSKESINSKLRITDLDSTGQKILSHVMQFAANKKPSPQQIVRETSKRPEGRM